jgi:transglutaminase-like putative cysteine protease
MLERLKAGTGTHADSAAGKQPDPATLAATSFVDAANGTIVATATRLVAGRTTEVERVSALYELVRDGNSGAARSSPTATPCCLETRTSPSGLSLGRS